MKYILIRIVVLGFALNAWAAPNKPCGSCISSILEGKIPVNDRRYHTFYRLFQIMQIRKPGVIVETGTARQGTTWCVGDGCSTLLFAQWIHKYGGVFYSVDIDSSALMKAAQAIEVETDAVHFVHSDSVDFLAQFNGTIDCLYLDSYDFEEDNPTPSQKHHLREIQAAYPHLSQNSIVMIDDCDLPHGGKGKLVIEFLEAKGWKVVERGYQVIMMFGRRKPF
jgi:predicted O-methyltransferase YrrM